MIGKVKIVNNVKTVVPLSNEVATDSVASGNMESVTSNAVAEKLNEELSLGGFIKKSSSGIISSVTLPSSNFYEFTTNVPNGHQILFCTINSWSTNTDCFSVIPYSSTRAFIIGKSGTQITNLEIISYYI